MNNAPPPIAPILAPAGNFQGNAMDRIYGYIVNGLVEPNDNELVFFPQVVSQIEANLNNHLNAQQQYRLNNLRNRYQNYLNLVNQNNMINNNNMINDNNMVGFGRRRYSVKSVSSPSPKKKKSSKKSPKKSKKSRRNSKLRTVMKSIERRLNKIRSHSKKTKKIRSPKSKKSSRKSRSRK